MSLKKSYRDGRRAAARINRKSGWKSESNKELLDQALADMKLEKEEKETFANAFMDALADDGEPTNPDSRPLKSVCCQSDPKGQLDDQPYVDYGEPANGNCSQCNNQAEFTPGGDEYDNPYWEEEVYDEIDEFYCCDMCDGTDDYDEEDDYEEYYDYE